MADDELTRDLPCARQPCLHRIFADCPPDAGRILTLAGRYGLLTVSIRRAPEPGQVVHADALPPEPLEIWRDEIQALRACIELWATVPAGKETAAVRESLGRKIAEHLARAPFHLKASPQGFRYCPVTLRAEPHSGSASPLKSMVIHPIRCPAPNCGRWFLRGAGARSDKRFCSNACKNRAFRRALATDR